MTSDDPRALRVLRRIAAWRTPSPRQRGGVLIVAGVVFVAGVIVSLRELDVELAAISWLPLIVVGLVGTPSTIIANAAELKAMARCLQPDLHLSWRTSVRVVVVATAANILPLPGGALVRVHALRSAGATVTRATSVTLTAALVWVSAAVALAGAVGAAYAPFAGGVAAVIGLAGLGIAAVAMRAAATAWSLRPFAELVAVELATTLIHAARLYLVLLALDVDVVPTQSVVLGAAAPLAAAAGVFPSGLGLAELLSALLAPAVALTAAAGFAATALARVVGLVSTAPLAAWLGISDVRPNAVGPTDASP